MARCAAIVVAAMLLDGCAALLTSYGALSDEKAKALLDHGEAIVLMRLGADRDGEPFDATLDAIDLVNSYIVDLVSLTNEKETTLGPPYRTPSAAARSAGWIYEALTPGSYFMRVTAPGERSERREVPNDYRFTVSAGAITYVGSFHVTCTTSKALFTSLPGACTGAEEVIDETDAARSAAERWLGAELPFRAALARPYASQLGVNELAALRPLALVVTATDFWREPDWNRLGENQKRRAGAGADLWTGGGLGGAYPPEGVAALMVFAGAVRGVSKLVDAVGDAATRAKWEPCIEALVRGVETLDLAALASRAVEAAAGGSAFTRFDAAATAPPSGPAAGDAYRGVLHFNVRRIRLADCEESLFVCVELAVRARVIDLAASDTLYDAVHVYTAPLHSASHALWERPVAAQATCRPLAGFCGEGGWQAFEVALEEGLAAVARAVVADLGLEPSHEPDQSSFSSSSAGSRGQRPHCGGSPVSATGL